MGVRSEEARRFYEGETLRGGWTIRQLDRQIGTQFYERTALSRNKATMLRRGEVRKPGDVVTAEEELKDPYMLELLGLKDEYSETDLEAALIAQIESTLASTGCSTARTRLLASSFAPRRTARWRTTRSKDFRTKCLPPSTELRFPGRAPSSPRYGGRFSSSRCIMHRSGCAPDGRGSNLRRRPSRISEVAVAGSRCARRPGSQMSGTGRQVDS